LSVALFVCGLIVSSSVAVLQEIECWLDRTAGVPWNGHLQLIFQHFYVLLLLLLLLCIR
jgi:hypothetical protein